MLYGGLPKCAKFGCWGDTFQGCWLLLALYCTYCAPTPVLNTTHSSQVMLWGRKRAMSGYLVFEGLVLMVFPSVSIAYALPGVIVLSYPARTICSIIEHHDNVSLPDSKMLLREHWEKFPCPFLELISQYYCMVVCVPFLISCFQC